MYCALWRSGKVRESADPGQAARWLEAGAVLTRQQAGYHVVARNVGRRGYEVKLYRAKGGALVFGARATAEAAVAAMVLCDEAAGEGRE